MSTENYIKAKNTFLILFSQAIGLIILFLLIVIGIAADLGGVMLFIGLVVFIASIIYSLVKLCQLVSEINFICEDDGEHLMPYICACLLGIITFGIYYI